MHIKDGEVLVLVRVSHFTDSVSYLSPGRLGLLVLSYTMNTMTRKQLKPRLRF